jgi:hypothetical protein
MGIPRLPRLTILAWRLSHGYPLDVRVDGYPTVSITFCSRGYPMAIPWVSHGYSTDTVEHPWNAKNNRKLRLSHGYPMVTVEHPWNICETQKIVAN